jgi:hypothetical protein
MEIKILYFFLKTAVGQSPPATNILKKARTRNLQRTSTRQGGEGVT